MTPPPHTSTVFVSDRLRTDRRFASVYQDLADILDRHGIEHHTLRGTADIWCRDYMPVPVGPGRFVRFRYDPPYLKRWPHLVSDNAAVCALNGIRAAASDIVLDGGNVVAWTDRVLMTDQVVHDNPTIPKRLLLSRLEALFDARVILLPRQPGEPTGHADGLIRWVDGDTVLVTDRSMDRRSWVRRLNRVLRRNGLTAIDVPGFEDRRHPASAIGCSINCLEVGDLIVLPVFDVRGSRSDEVEDLFRDIFPDRTIETIEAMPLAMEGGVLNCCTWTV